MARVGAFALAAVIVLAAVDAVAQPTPVDPDYDPDHRHDAAHEEPAGDRVPVALRHEVALDARWWSAATVGSTLPFALRGQMLATEHLGVGFTMPWTLTSEPDAFARTIAAVGNPTVDLFYAARAGAATWRGGLGISFPLASADEDVGWYFATAYAIAAHAYYDGFLHQWGYLPIRAFGDVEIRASRAVAVHLGIAPMLYVPVVERAQVSPGLSLRTDGVEHYLQEFADLRILSVAGFGGGLRLQAVEFLTLAKDDDADLIQLGMEPYLAYDDRVDGHVFARLGLLMALDENAGFAFDEYKVATGHLTVGAYWDGSRGAR